MGRPLLVVSSATEGGGQVNRYVESPKDSCPQCGQIVSTVLTGRDRNRGVSDVLFEYLWCGACGSLTLANVPADLERYYPSGPYGLPAADALLDLLADEEYKVGLLAARVLKGGSLLEVGPGAGAFALAAKRFGYKVIVVEMDADTCLHMEDVVGVPPLGRVILPLRSLNFISLWKQSRCGTRLSTFRNRAERLRQRLMRLCREGSCSCQPQIRRRSNCDFSVAAGCISTPLGI